jgi:hypothetical protein
MSEQRSNDRFLDEGKARFSAKDRELMARKLPFILRTWWLRDHSENSDYEYGEISGATSLLRSVHSDPICDSANMDFPIL